MTVATVLAAFKTKAATLAPSTGAAERNYAIPADVTVGEKDGGLLFDTLPITFAAQRLGNDEGENRTEIIAAGCYGHFYSVELMVAIATAENINKQLEKDSSIVVFAPYENTAQLWLIAWHNALEADRTLGGVLSGLTTNPRIISDYRIGYLPLDKPELWGLWLSVDVVEEI